MKWEKKNLIFLSSGSWGIAYYRVPTSEKKKRIQEGRKESPGESEHFFPILTGGLKEKKTINEGHYDGQRRWGELTTSYPRKPQKLPESLFPRQNGRNKFK